MYGERKKAQPRGPLWVGTERSCSSLETVPSIPELGGGGGQDFVCSPRDFFRPLKVISTRVELGANSSPRER